MMKNIALLLARVISGTLVAGHGSQKLFGWFEGPGLQGWSSATEEHMGMKPGKVWGPLGAVSEFGGGVLTALGLLNPIGPIAAGSMMVAASYKAHWGKPIWAAKGGAELALSFLATSAAIGAVGPGKYSLDSLLGIRLPRWVIVLSLLASAGLLAETVHPTVSPRLMGDGNTPEVEPIPELSPEL